MTPLEIFFASGSLAFQGGTMVAVFYGIFRMGRANDLRAAREDVRHAEAMEALRQQDAASRRRDEDARRRDEAFQQALREQGEALRAAIHGLETLIERTGGRQSGPNPS